MSWNPFDLRGPEFLLFYATMAIGTFFLVWWRLRLTESGTAQEVESAANEIAKDPYQIAFLRDGVREEAARVALISLIERSLLEAHGANLIAVGFETSDKTRRPLDKAILTRFLKERSALGIFF